MGHGEESYICKIRNVAAPGNSILIWFWAQILNAKMNEYARQNGDSWWKGHSWSWVGLGTYSGCYLSFAKVNYCRGCISAAMATTICVDNHLEKTKIMIVIYESFHLSLIHHRKYQQAPISSYFVLWIFQGVAKLTLLFSSHQMFIVYSWPV